MRMYYVWHLQKMSIKFGKVVLQLQVFNQAGLTVPSQSHVCIRFVLVCAQGVYCSQGHSSVQGGPVAERASVGLSWLICAGDWPWPGEGHVVLCSGYGQLYQWEIWVMQWFKIKSAFLFLGKKKIGLLVQHHFCFLSSRFSFNSVDCYISSQYVQFG